MSLETIAVTHGRALQQLQESVRMLEKLDRIGHEDAEELIAAAMNGRSVRTLSPVERQDALL